MRKEEKLQDEADNKIRALCSRQQKSSGTMNSCNKFNGEITTEIKMSVIDINKKRIVI